MVKLLNKEGYNLMFLSYCICTRSIYLNKVLAYYMQNHSQEDTLHSFSTLASKCKQTFVSLDHTTTILNKSPCLSTWNQDPSEASVLDSQIQRAFELLLQLHFVSDCFPCWIKKNRNLWECIQLWHHRSRRNYSTGFFQRHSNLYSVIPLVMTSKIE